eukprot:3296774-Rhodomonas_salina.1
MRMTATTTLGKEEPEQRLSKEADAKGEWRRNRGRERGCRRLIHTRCAARATCLPNSGVGSKSSFLVGHEDPNSRSFQAVHATSTLCLTHHDSTSYAACCLLAENGLAGLASYRDQSQTTLSSTTKQTSALVVSAS